MLKYNVTIYMYLVQQVTYYFHPLGLNFSSNGHRNGFKHMNCSLRCIDCAGAGIQMLTVFTRV